MDKEQKRKNKSDGYNEKTVKNLSYFLHKLRDPIDVMYYLMGKGQINNFALILISFKDPKIVDVVQHQKRETDIVIEYDVKKNMLAILCQDTKVDGGYYFVKRTIEAINKEYNENIYCSVVAVHKANHSIVDIGVRALSLFNKAIKMGNDTEIQYYSIK